MLRVQPRGMREHGHDTDIHAAFGGKRPASPRCRSVRHHLSRRPLRATLRGGERTRKARRKRAGAARAAALDATGEPPGHAGLRKLYYWHVSRKKFIHTVTVV